MNLHRFDLVRTKPEYGGRLFVVSDVQDGKVRCLEMTNKKIYRLRPDQITAVVGTAPPDVFDDDPSLTEGRRYALMMAETAPPDVREKWQILATLVPDRLIEVSHRGKIYPAKFVQINVGRPKFCLRAEVRNRVLDLPIESLYAVSTPK